jgi:4-aminobutyrate aminotransferase-like enzyme
MILDPFFVNEGFPSLASGFLDPAIAVIRKHGGVIIADEVQPGFGRIGTHFWGHLKAGFAPDIVTMGKPMGNGHPVACVATSFEIISAFRKAFRYFNTFGGNPVSCAAANAVLDVLACEDLPAKAVVSGEYLRAGFRKLAEKHDLIGDVRGSGLANGLELVLDRTTKAPATEIATRIINEMRQRGLLMGSNGINYNVLKIRPPLAFGLAEADQLLSALDDVLSAL